jgi:KUP system potassium uptake protein
MLPAIIGGGFLIADGIITPPISVSSAIEGLRAINPEINTVPIVIAILVMLFTIQQFGTNFIGKFFGPVMVFWFTTIGVFGLLRKQMDIRKDKD